MAMETETGTEATKNRERKLIREEVDEELEHDRWHDRAWWAAILALIAVVLAAGTSVIAVRQVANTNRIAALTHRDHRIEAAAIAQARKQGSYACSRTQSLREHVNHNSRVIHAALVSIALSRKHQPSLGLPYDKLLALAGTLGVEAYVDCRRPDGPPKFTLLDARHAPGK